MKLKVNLPSRDSATGRGLFTVVQSTGGFFVGLIVTVLAVPGVQDAIISYVQKNAVDLLIFWGLPAVGATWGVTFLMNFWRKKIPNY